MASRSFINICTALTISWFCGERVLEKCPESDPSCRKVRRIAAKCIDLSKNARILWQECSHNEANEVQRKVARFESEVLQGHGQITQMITIGLALLQDAIPHLKHYRAIAISDLADTMQKLLEQFDRQWEDTEVYDKALQNINAWYELNNMEGVA